MTIKQQRRIVEQLARQLPTPSENRIVSGKRYKLALKAQLAALIHHGISDGQDKLQKQISGVDESKHYQLGGTKHVQRVNHARRLWELYVEDKGRITDGSEQGTYEVHSNKVSQYISKHKLTEQDGTI
jgi:hypothetical protein